MRLLIEQVLTFIVNIWQPETWHELKQRLRPRGRIMVNCGGSCVECRDSQPDCDDGTWTWEDGSAARDATLYAMAHVFPQVAFFPLRIVLPLLWS